ncbi:MAG: hypothetical protein AB2765_07860 [Candidatus Thiodiazotropha endolucinida]
MPKKVLGKQVGSIHKVQTKWTFGDFVTGAIIAFFVIAVLFT